MDYWRSDNQAYVPGVLAARGPGELPSSASGGRLRVFLLGGIAGDHFQSILAANIERWGYEAICLDGEEVHSQFHPSIQDSELFVHSDEEEGDVEGDILLYDIDVPLQSVPMPGINPKRTSRVGSQAAFLGTEYPRTRLLVALSSRSVSRLALEQMGAITHLRKPVDMRHLERYLRVFQQLFAVEKFGVRAPDLQVLSGLAGRLPVGEEDAPATSASRKKRILIADDQQEMTRAICQCLLEQDTRHYHYEVREVHDGLDLLEQCVSWRPDCVVTDLLMPWLNGYQVMHCLAVSSCRPIPAFVVISALTRHEIPGNRLYLQDKAVLYVDKPFEVENLLALIEQALAQ